MMQWVSQKDRTPLEEGESSFRRLAFRWLATIEELESDTEEDRWPEVARFFAYLEANAEEYWNAPVMELDGSFGDLFDDLDDVDYFEDEEDELDEEEEEDVELFGAAYEEMVYRDTTDDGNESELYDEALDYEESEWEYEVQRLDQRLYFLSTVANLWKHAAIVWGRLRPKQADSKDSTPSEVFSQWLNQGGTNYKKLTELVETVHRFQFPLPSGNHDSLMEYDRLRTTKESLIQQIITTCVEMADASRLLAATCGTPPLKAIESLAEPIDRTSVDILPLCA